MKKKITRVVIFALIAALLLGVTPLYAADSVTVPVPEKPVRLDKFPAIDGMLIKGGDYAEGELMFGIVDTPETRAMGFSLLYTEDAENIPGASPCSEIAELLDIQFGFSKIELVNATIRLRKDGKYYSEGKENNIFHVKLKDISIADAIEALSRNPLMAYAEPNYIYYIELPPQTDPVTPPLATLPFTDIKQTDWFADSVVYVCETRLMNGVADDRFAPNVSLSRAMAVTVLYRRAGRPEVSGDMPFNDVKEGKWYTDAVKWAYANGIVTGTSASTFSPDAPIKRQDLAAMLYNCNNKILKLNLKAKRFYPGFGDDAQISDYAKAAVKAFYEAGMINGKSAERFDPKGTATRAEAAAMLHRLLQLPAAVDPIEVSPVTFTADSFEALLSWINTENAEPAEAWESMRAARESGHLLTVQPNAEDVSLKTVMVQSGYARLDCFFQKENDRFEILIALPGEDEAPLPERMTQINRELALAYDGWQYTKATVSLNGTDTAIYFCDGGEYARKDSLQKELVAPTAFFVWQGHTVTIRGIDRLYGTKWDNAYLSLFDFEVVQLS